MSTFTMMNASSICLFVLLVLHVAAAYAIENKNANLKLRNELEDMFDAKFSMFDAKFRIFDAKYETLETKYKRLRDENAALRDELAEIRQTPAAEESSFGKNEAILLITQVLEKSKNSRSLLEARLEAVENTQVSQWSDPTDQGTITNTNGRSPSRRLSTVDSAVLEDAALWMQAKNAKILFGQSADANLYRSGEEQIATDSNLIIKKDLTVLGENWHLTTMLTAEENITVGSVVSLCADGKACVGYGLASTGFMATSQPAADIKVIHLGGADSLAVMYYRKWTGNSHESEPKMRMVKPLHAVNRDYSGDPFIG